MRRCLLLSFAAVSLVYCSKPPPASEEILEIKKSDPTETGVGPTRTWPPPRSGYVNPVIAENTLVGDAKWSWFQKKATAGQIEGYADRVTAKAGEHVALHVSAEQTSMRLGRCIA